MMDPLFDTLAQLLQPAPDTRDTFAWLGTAADILAILSAVVAVFAWWRARKAATEAQEAVRGLRERLGRSEAYAAAVSLSDILRELVAAQDAEQWRSVLTYHRQAQRLVGQIRGHGRTKILSDIHDTKLASAATEFTANATAIEIALLAGQPPLANLDLARYNSFIATTANTIEEIKIVLRYTM